MSNHRKSDERRMLRFNDPMVKSTDWKTMAWGGHRFQDYAGDLTGVSRYEFKITDKLRKYTLRLPIFLTGMGLLFFFIYLSVGIDPVLTIMFLVFLPLTGFVTAFLYRRALQKPFVFDTELGYFWRGRPRPGASAEYETNRIHVELESIHALQLLHQYVRNFPWSFHCYELNLVFKDGSRWCVLNHGDLNGIRKNAAGLAAFLGVPLWDDIKKDVSLS